MLSPLEKARLKQYLLVANSLAVVSAIGEYLVRFDTTDPQALLPLFARSFVIATLIALSLAIFDFLLRPIFQQRTFGFLVLTRSLAYTLIVVFWLTVVNGSWQVIVSNVSFIKGVENYVTDPSFPINLISIFVFLSIALTVFQINSLHRKGELLSFIMGRYHRPQEVNRTFLFLDLKNSTGIAEKLGHYQFGLFLKDFYADVTMAIWATKAEIYQYVGDEVILAWPIDSKGSNQVIRCLELIHQTIEEKQQTYLRKYSYIPEFRAAAHGGRVLVTWVGEIKKDIVYVGDVLNTTARILEDCKRLNFDFLLSEQVAEQLNGSLLEFREETIPRGKEKSIKLYSLTEKNHEN